MLLVSRLFAFVFRGHSQLTGHVVRRGLTSGAHKSLWFVFFKVETDGDFPDGPTGAVQLF